MEMKEGAMSTTKWPTRHSLADATVSDTQLLRAWGQFLGRVPWQFFVTLTFRFEVGRAPAVREAQQFCTHVGQATRSPVAWLLAPERHRSGSWHVHVLLVGVPGEIVGPVAMWRQRNGRVDVREVTDGTLIVIYATKSAALLGDVVVSDTLARYRKQLGDSTTVALYPADEELTQGTDASPDAPQHLEPMVRPPVRVPLENALVRSVDATIPHISEARQVVPEEPAFGRHGDMTPKKPERQAQALHGVNRTALCRGCGRAFEPARATQRHCKPSCRVLACRRRTANNVRDLLASGIGAGHVEPDVMPDEEPTEPRGTEIIIPGEENINPQVKVHVGDDVDVGDREQTSGGTDHEAGVDGDEHAAIDGGRIGRGRWRR